MTPFKHPYSTACLLSLRFEARADDEVIANADNVPIAVEDDGFSSWWKPIWRERIGILCGKPVRVLVNCSLYGPLHLDTHSRWGSSRWEAIRVSKYFLARS